MAAAATATAVETPEVKTPGGSSLDLTIGNAILRKAAMANAKLSQTMDVDLKAFMAKGASLPSGGGATLPRGRGLPRGGATLPTSGGGVLYHTSFNRKLMNYEKNYGKFAAPAKEAPGETVVKDAPGTGDNFAALFASINNSRFN